MNIAKVGLVPEPVKTRSYRSVARRQQAEATRRAVLTAAHRLFTRHGYADTPVAEVAAAAKVSVDTVYASVGRKPQLLLAVHDMVLGSADEPVPAESRDYVVAIRQAQGARAKIDVYAEALGRLLPRTVPIADALRVAALTDPGCRAVWEGLNERRARNMRLFAADLRATGELRDDLSDDDVADLVWSTNSPEFYLLTTSRGRTPEQYAALVRDLWTRTLLA
jgi:AcrR family transcriptional regulator